MSSRLNVAKRILNYIKGTMDHGLIYSTIGDVEFIGFNNKDRAGNYDDWKSTTSSCSI